MLEQNYDVDNQLSPLLYIRKRHDLAHSLSILQVKGIDLDLNRVGELKSVCE